MSETQPVGGCPVCGTPAHIGCEHSKQSPEAGDQPEFSRELLPRMANLEFEVRADFSATLEGLRERTGADLQPRPEGYHVTIVGPTESKVLAGLEEADMAELEAINAEIKAGTGVEVKGIGYIDGSDEDKWNLRDADRTKKTAFIALDIPRLAAFREKVGLAPKDFHVTLGFEGGDIHMQVTGQEEYKPGKFKDIKEAIPKQADPDFADVPLPELGFGGLGGQLKPEKKEKEQPPKKEKQEKKQTEYDPDKLRALLQELIASGNSGGITEDRIDSIVDTATTNPNNLGRELRADFRFVRPLLEQAEK